MERPEYEVNITGASNGIVVQIGCKKLVFKEAELGEFFADLSSYLTGGYTAQRELRKKYFNEADAVEQCAPPCAPVMANGRG